MSENQLRALSLQRVTELFDREGWNYDVDETRQALKTGFSSIGMEIKFLDPTLSVVTTVAVDTITADRFDDVLPWVEGYNQRNAFPSVTALQDETRDITAMGASYSLPGYWEYTDEEFAAQLLTGIQGVVQAARDFLTEFAPEVTQQIDSKAF